MQRKSCGTARRKALDKCLRKSYTICVVKNIWAYSSAGSASVSLLCPTELWAFKWGVCRLVAQPRHAPKYGPIAQLGERSVRIREVKGSNPSRSTNLPHRFVRCGVFYAQKNFGRPCRAPNPEAGCEPGGFFHRRRRRYFCQIHPRASCRVVWKYSLGVMPYSFLKARKKWL